MKLIFLDSARSDLAWMRNYYARVFPQGAANAAANMRATRRMLTANPSVGHPTDTESLRELQISRTPFALIYRVNGARIEVLRVWDCRADRGGMRLD